MVRWVLLIYLFCDVAMILKTVCQLSVEVKERPTLPVKNGVATTDGPHNKYSDSPALDNLTFVKQTLTVADCDESGNTVIRAASGIVHILTNPRQALPVFCKWTIPVPFGDVLHLKFHKLEEQEATSDSIQLSPYNNDTRFKFSLHIKGNYLSFQDVYFVLNVSTSLLYQSGSGEGSASVITFSFNVSKSQTEDSFFLNNIQLTDSSYFLTSPFFDGKTTRYFKSVNTSVDVLVPDGYIMVGVFSHFDLGHNCNDSYLFITSVDHTMTYSTLCGIQNYLPLQRFQSSVSVTFVSVDHNGVTGFKLLYSILPLSHEPQKMASGLYDCSVSYFSSFRELFSCNLNVECEGGEDEKGCDYNSSGCRPGEVNTGQRCYQFVWPDTAITWTDAYHACEDHEQDLVTMAKPEEWINFRRLMSLGTKFNQRPVFIGLHCIDINAAAVSPLYGDVWEWVDDRAAFYNALTETRVTSKPICVYYSHNSTHELTAVECDVPLEAIYICESDKPGVSVPQLNVVFPSLANTTSVSVRSVVSCDSGELTHDFLVCDHKGPCRENQQSASCVLDEVELPMFQCYRKDQTISYTLVCDHRNQCPDYSDEDFCVFQQCDDIQFECRNGQCFEMKAQCDGVHHCIDSSDENCPQVISSVPPLLYPPVRVDMDGKGSHTLHAMGKEEICPNTHFLCPEGYCLPVFLRCNLYADCPGREDEKGCDRYQCPGFYHCRDSTVCLHPIHLCDDTFQCPQKDDESQCTFRCPQACHCQGLAFKCSQIFDVAHFPALRYLDASGTSMTPNHVQENFYLIRLRLSDCQLTAIPNITLQNLRHLDLSFNLITTLHISSFKDARNLLVLILSSNPLDSIVPYSCTATLPLEEINVANTKLEIYDDKMFSCFGNLKSINISSSSLTEITETGFDSTPKLEHLDLNHNPLQTFPLTMLRELTSLKTVSADSYKLCCRETLPADFDVTQCKSQADILASCEDLLQSNVYRVFLWLFASLAVGGNVSSFVTRVYLQKDKSAAMGSFGILVTSLSFADFLMGVYLMMIGAADQLYMGKYVWKDEDWKNSLTCHIAGVVSFVSSEVSAFMICLITLDRFLVLRFPFSRFHFGRKSAIVACVMAWFVGVTLAMVPLLPATSHWNYYGQSGVCIPLPFSSTDFRGYPYSFSVMIMLNFIMFLLIAVGQIIIYMSVRSNSILNQTTRSRDATIARRLTTIIVSDFCCWFPIGLIGLLASTGSQIPPEINVLVAIFVLPFNSALNPFLYTMNIIMEKRRKAEEERLIKQLEKVHFANTGNRTEESGMKNKATNKESAMSQLDTWLSTGLLTPEDIESRLKHRVTCE